MKGLKGLSFGFGLWARDMPHKSSCTKVTRHSGYCWVKGELFFDARPSFKGTATYVVCSSPFGGTQALNGRYDVKD